MMLQSNTLATMTLLTPLYDIKYSYRDTVSNEDLGASDPRSLKEPCSASLPGSQKLFSSFN